MLNYHQSSTAILNPAIFTRKSFDRVLPSVNRGNVSVSAELRHLSLIVYAVPSDRVKALIPSSFQVEETVSNGKAMAWISVESFLDKNSIGHSAFEQTNYRLHVMRDGQPCRWLLGSSLGSLSAVGIRNLWPMPWHLSAMEFQIAYDQASGRYNQYRLQTQSQWANSCWQISDTGQAIDQETMDKIGLPASILARHANDVFARRDGSIGSQRSAQFSFEFTRAKLIEAKCDLLESLGLLTVEELMQPALVVLQQNASRQIFSPAVISESQKNSSPHEIAEWPLAFAS